MRKTIIIAFTAIICGFIFTNCGNNNNQTKAYGIEFDSIVIDTVAKLTNDVNSPSCHISLHLHYAKGKLGEKINDTLMRSGVLSPDYLSLSNMKLSTKQAVDSFIKRYIEDYRDFYYAIYRDDKNTRQADLAYSLKTQIKEGGNGIVCYIADISNKMGTSEANYSIVKNILASNGHIVALDDILVPGAEKEINKIITEQLCNDTGCKDEEELNEKGYFVNIDVYPSRNFILDEDYIEFIYIEGEIADRNKGEIRVRIDYSDIKKLMKQWK